MQEQSRISQALRQHFSFDPTTDQSRAIEHLAAFDQTQRQAPVYILKGYAGTGKTSLISAYVNYLAGEKKPFVLLAPTGRAAKVLARYTGFEAGTIHRHIYQLFTNKDGSMQLQLAHNRFRNTVFIIDEASMINDDSRQSDSLFSGRSLLDDLMTYVFGNYGNKMVLVGDTAQLPPVGLQLSPALDLDFIKSSFPVTAYEFEMREVMRQTADSGILSTATRLRERLQTGETAPPFFSRELFKNDLVRISNGYAFEELLQEAFTGQSADEAVLVCRTNKRANLFNRQIRERILQREAPLEGGDTLMVVKNNYFWLEEGEPGPGFIANGDMLRVLRVVRFEEMYGFRFAESDVQLVDYPGQEAFTVKLLLDTIESEGPGLSRADSQKLFAAVEADYGHLKSRSGRMNKIRKNPYFNALHVKFAYALTCHKTQGGQWPTVIVDQGFLKPEMIDTEYLRWLYTALTRATEKLYLIGFNDDFFVD